MAIILNIDTAVSSASICLAAEKKSLQWSLIEDLQDQAAWLHVAIKELFSRVQMDLSKLDAVAVTNGPGSYTGLRVGMATAKGLCYALNIPLITINTLDMMVMATIGGEADLFCPLIDARRKEVFTAVYDQNRVRIEEPRALILEATSFNSLLNEKTILFSGNGKEKLREIIQHPNALFSDKMATATEMVELSAGKFDEQRFDDVAYSEPLYIKEFYSPAH